MKIILLVLFVGGPSPQGVQHSLEYEVPTMAYCESLAENLNEIFEIDPALENVKVSMSCLEMPK